MACIVAYSGVYYTEQGAYTPGVPPELRNTFRAEVMCRTRSELYSQHLALRKCSISETRLSNQVTDLLFSRGCTEMYTGIKIKGPTSA